MKNLKITKIHLILENCESIDIPLENVTHIGFNITKRSYSSYNWFENNTISEYLGSDYVCLHIKNLDKIFINPICEEEEPNKFAALARLTRHPDITSIELTLENGDIFQVHVPWGSFNDWFNSYQKLTKKENYQHETEWVLKLGKRFTIATLKANWRYLKQRFKRKFRKGF